MATDVERLVVSLEASITKYDRAMSKALGITNNTMQRIERRQMTAIQRVNAGWTGMQRGIATAFAGAAALRGAQVLIDTSTRIENSLKVVGLEGEELTRVYERLFASAQRNMAPVETLTTLYSRLGLAQKELGVTNDELLNFTDKVALALRVQGTTAQEARGALIQLSQAMGSGIVRAEEFNSVVEGAPSILRAAAAGLKEANGSVAQLRKLVIDGKLSSEAFFRAFEAGSVILEEQVAGAEVTVSQGFVRLQNVLIDTAGKFDDATGASDLLAQGLNEIATGAEQFGTWLSENGDEVKGFFSNVATVITATQEAAKKLGRETGLSQFGQFVEDLTGLPVSSDYAAQGISRAENKFDRFGESVSDADLALAEAEQALANFADHTVGKMGEVDAAAQDLFKQVLEGKGSADLAAEAIAALGDANPDFAPLLTKIGETIGQIYALRDAAVAATRVDVSGLPMSFAGQDGAGPPKVAPNPVSLSDYKAPAGVGGSGSGKSAGDRYADSVADMQQRIEALNAETAAMRSLNPLVNDYGFALEKVKATQELENAARKAGIELGPQQREQIEQLSTGYANATAAAAKLAEAQDRAKQGAEDLLNAGRQALDTIIDGFIEGRDAGEILNSVVKDLSRNLIRMGLNALGGGLFGGGGFLGGIFGFAKGGIAADGRPQPLRKFARGGVSKTAAIFGEAGPEAAVPLPDGRRIPVDLRLQAPPVKQVVVPPPQSVRVHIVSDDEKFGAYVTDRAGRVVAQSAPGIVGAAVNQANKTAPGAMARHQQQRAGSDYRV